MAIRPVTLSLPTTSFSPQEREVVSCWEKFVKLIHETVHVEAALKQRLWLASQASELHQKIQKTLPAASSTPSPALQCLSLSVLVWELEHFITILRTDGNGGISRQVFKSLPANLQRHIYDSVWLHLGAPEQDRCAELALEQDLSLLLKIREPWVYPHGEHLLEQHVLFLRERMEIDEHRAHGRFEAAEKRADLRKFHQHECFEALCRNLKMTPRQLRKMYNRLDQDVKKFHSASYPGHGVRYRMHERLGAHLSSGGVQFRVHAPHARQVCVAIKNRENGDDYAVLPMQRESKEVWGLFGSQIEEGSIYEYVIDTGHNTIRKADPFSFGSRESHRNYFHHESIVSRLRHVWTDQQWMERRRQTGEEHRAVNIYKVHPASWKQRDGRSLNYQEIGEQLSKYCLDMGYNYVEFMGILEHPNLDSMGYQVSGYFSPTFRMGSPSDFQAMVNTFHASNIGVILDWVPAHFAIDGFGLTNFDGVPLFEHPDARKKRYPLWDTFAFNYEQKSVRDFLISSAFFWFDKMHVDGLRIDAVEAMIDFNFCRPPQEHIANLRGSKWNLDAIRMLRDLNAVIHAEFPGALMIAEDASDFSMTTSPLNRDGLGFDRKWNFAFLHHILKYFHTQIEERPKHHLELLQALKCDSHERVVLPLSHDMGSLIGQMPGNTWRQFAQMRLFLTLMLSLPGNKLCFMGQEFAQSSLWRDQLLQRRSIAWHELHYGQERQGLHHCIRTMNHLYLSTPALWESSSMAGLEWVDGSDQQNSVISYYRRSKENKKFICLHHFGLQYIESYHLPLRNISLHFAKEIFNSDDRSFGGSGRVNTKIDILRNEDHIPYALKIQLPPLATAIFEIFQTN